MPWSVAAAHPGAGSGERLELAGQEEWPQSGTAATVADPQLGGACPEQRERLGAVEEWVRDGATVGCERCDWAPAGLGQENVATQGPGRVELCKLYERAGVGGGGRADGDVGGSHARIVNRAIIQSQSTFLTVPVS
jgi:hypothetical protein